MTGAEICDRKKIAPQIRTSTNFASSVEMFAAVPEQRKKDRSPTNFAGCGKLANWSEIRRKAHPSVPRFGRLLAQPSRRQSMVVQIRRSPNRPFGIETIDKVQLALQILVAPWSTESCVPVTTRDSSLASHRTALAMSSGSEMGGSNQY